MIRQHQKVSDILLDDDFIHYVFDPTPELREKWESFFRLYPEMLAVTESAKSILQDHTTSTLTKEEITSMEQNILAACDLTPAS